MYKGCLRNGDRLWLQFAAVQLLPLAVAACAGPAPYQTLGKAGETYAGAAEQTLVNYRNIYLDARSEAALNREIIGAAPGSTAFDLSMCRRPVPGNPAPAAPLSRFAEGQCNDVARVKVVSQLIAHLRLLGSYFRALTDLASSNAPAQAEASAKQIVSSLATIGTKLDGAAPGQLAALPPLARSGLGLLQRAALRRELERNGETIRRELQIEAKLLKWLKGEVGEEQANLFGLQFQRRVSVPVAAQRALQTGDQWVQDRRSLMLQTDQVADVGAAETALASLAAAFDALLQGGDADQQLGQLIADVNLMLDVAEPFVGRK